MDEAVKYQQRLQAIAEKRRLQEEEDRARREMEEERLRLQQLKRKSLRDQWLMEGPPTSPDSSGPRSPLWGPQAQEMEARIEKLQSETERGAQEKEKQQQHMKDDSAVNDSNGGVQGNSKGDAGAEEVAADSESSPSGEITENGKIEREEASLNADDGQSSQEESAQIHNGADTAAETATNVALVNGAVEGEKVHDPSDQDGLPHTNGLTSEQTASVGIGEGAVTLTFLGYSEAEPGQGVSEDDDCGAVIRAERVIITDEGDELPDEQPDPSANETEESTVPAESLESPESTEVEPHLETSADAEKKTEETETKVTESAENTADAMETEIEKSEGGGVEAQVSDISEAQLQAETLEGSVATSQVPVYSTTEPSVTPRADGEEEVAQADPIKDDDTEVSGQDATGQFQEVPLDGATDVKEPTAKQQTPSAEEEPLLSSKATPLTETQTPSRAEAEGTPKRKTCQCCSVM
ncbi:paralemmin-3 [Chanos chanos]|uniref:Paralemmin-1-like n=1 Tax=Chanos chanos TaxID=29144 RepID=A0A6J2W0X3_CHACN|nr:paralemmin-1-like [Chanos chanos]XP_030637957.1 paralemmin-1-like [Chanos chanos]